MSFNTKSFAHTIPYFTTNVRIINTSSRNIGWTFESRLGSVVKNPWPLINWCIVILEFTFDPSSVYILKWYIFTHFLTSNSVMDEIQATGKKAYQNQSAWNTTDFTWSRVEKRNLWKPIWTMEWDGQWICNNRFWITRDREYTARVCYPYSTYYKRRKGDCFKRDKFWRRIFPHEQWWGNLHRASCREKRKSSSIQYPYN